jgi:hypothetical protein
VVPLILATLLINALTRSQMLGASLAGSLLSTNVMLSLQAFIERQGHNVGTD